jgi:hypothetical protein
MLKNFILVIALVSFSIAGFAQRITQKSGSVAVLKGQTTLNVEYDYSNFGVGKFENEADFVSKKVEEHNAKEAGKGDEWKEGWISARENRYEPKFEELFNKGAEKLGLKVVGGDKTAKYTLIVRTTFLEPGFNVGVMRKPASVNFEFDIVETASPSKKVSEQSLNNVPGAQFGGYDFDIGSRVAESYAKAGKVLAVYLLKELK